MGQTEKSSSSSFPWKEFFTFLGVIAAAYIGYLGIRSQIEIPLQATQTAEAKTTLISSSQTPQAIIPTTIPPSFTPTILISVPIAITTPSCPLSIGQKVDLRENVRFWTKPDVLEGKFSLKQLEISVYILSGPEWGRVRNDIDYSGWWWEVSASENGSSLGWVWEMGFEECDY